MCGIAGILNLNGSLVSKTELKEMTDIIGHRGPEEEGFYISRNIGLGHRRLKIIDLSENAKQPMSNENGKIWLVYNGEIYNYIELRKELISLGHIFKSGSDSEVVVHAYEEWNYKCLDKFVGMWAFAIWDEERNILFASRDRTGIKPFYYFFNKHVFIFASEMKAILEFPGIDRYANLQSLYEYLYLGYSLGDKTWIRGITRLNPAHYLILNNGNLSIERYWQINNITDYSLTIEKVQVDLRRLLNDSVQLMLRSDVEVGAHLSGGIDSVSIAGIANLFYPNRIRTFSGMFKEGKEFDESFYIKEAVAKYNIQNERVIIKQDNFIENLKKIVWYLDEPIAGPGAYPQYFLSKFINSYKIKVVIGGQGGDELFGGYPHYYSGILTSLSRFKKLYSVDYRKYYNTKDLYLKFIPAYMRRVISNALSFRKSKLNSILNKGVLRSINFDSIYEKTGFYKGSVEEMQLWDINNYLPALLQVEDRLSMASSVETRLPFLNHKLIEFAFSLPIYFKINSLNFKYILRMAMKDILPESVFQRKDKKGFPTPIKIWLSNAELIKNIASEFAPELSSFFTDKQLTWGKINIALWFKIYKINL